MSQRSQAATASWVGDECHAHLLIQMLVKPKSDPTPGPSMLDDDVRLLIWLRRMASPRRRRRSRRSRAATASWWATHTCPTTRVSTAAAWTWMTWRPSCTWTPLVRPKPESFDK